MTITPAAWDSRGVIFIAYAVLALILAGWLLLAADALWPGWPPLRRKR